MSLTVTKVDVWAGQIEDKPGGLATVLGAISGAGGNLECVIARRDPTKPGAGVAFATPVKGAGVRKAAKAAGLAPAANIATLKVEGDDAAGLGHRIMSAIAGAGVNVRGASGAVIGRKFVVYLGFDVPADATKAARALKALGAAGKSGKLKASR
jgi:predicted amino acid-binding ACT domain protein